MMTERFERRDLKRVMLVVDALVVLAFFAGLALLARDAFVAGGAEAGKDINRQSVHLWYMARDVALVVLSFGYIATRFLRTKFRQINTPWLA